MKKKLIILAAVVACIAIAAAGTLAYFTATGTATNVITTGKIDIEVVEMTKNEAGEEVPFPKEGIQNILPGNTVSKIVTVQTADGSGDAWIRVKLEGSFISAEGKELDTSVLSYKLNLAEDGWIDGEDGYYYYAEPVSAGEETDVLLEEVTFSTEMGNAYQNGTANVIVTAQAVQVKHNEIPEGGSVLDVLGWPND